MVHVYSKSFRIYELLSFSVNADDCGLITFTFQFSTALKNPVWENPPPTLIFKNLKTKLKHERKQKKKDQEMYNVYVLF